MYSREITHITRLKNAPIIFEAPGSTEFELDKKEPSFPLIVSPIVQKFERVNQSHHRKVANHSRQIVQCNPRKLYQRH